MNNNTHPSFVLKGDIIYSISKDEILTVPSGYVVCVNGTSRGVFEKLPQEYECLSLHDYSGKLIIPGLVDLHIHAPQYAFRSMGMDQELMEWLQQQTFPEESKYSDLDYAQKAYQIFVDSMFRAVCDAVQVSKLYWRLIDQNQSPLTFREAFFLATKGGGSFFGRAGSFEPDYDFSAIVLDDSLIPHPMELSLSQRLERAAYGALDLYGICAKYVCGELIYRNNTAAPQAASS